MTNPAGHLGGNHPTSVLLVQTCVEHRPSPSPKSASVSRSSEVARDRGKRSLADFGRSWSDRDKESLEVCETAFADSRSFLPCPALHSSEVARVINTVAFAEGTSDRGRRSLADFG